MEKKFIFEQLTTVTLDDKVAIRNLVKQLGEHAKPLTDDDLSEMISSPNIFLLVAKDETKIVGMITVIVYRIPYTKKAYLDDLVVDESYRGHGLGGTLMKKAIELAQEKKVAYVDLTASPHRTAGNKLYEKLGFQKRETNVYRKTFDYGQR